MIALKKIIPNPFYKKTIELYNNYLNGFKVVSYSQEGEDLVLKRFFEDKKNGFYVDIGAHHPKRFSNTFLFYKKGWKGINIEPRPGSKVLFDKIRQRDINLEIPVSNLETELRYYIFDDPALNSFDADLSNERHKNTKYNIIDEIKLKTQRLDSILDQYLPQNQIIDFLTIDVEGFDINVLESNNWSKYKPKIIVVEDAEYDFKMGSEITLYLESCSYKIFARTISTSFFKL
jgi:FkbM family methyltransferase